MREIEFDAIGMTPDGGTVAVALQTRSRRQGRLDLHDFTLQNHTGTALSLAALRLFDVDLGTAEVEVFRQGFYMPSDPTGFHLLQAGRTPPHDTHWRPSGLRPSQFSSHTMVVVNPSLPTCQRRLLGFTTFGQFEGYFVLDTADPTIRISAWMKLEGITIPPDTSLPLEQLAVCEGPDFSLLLETYTDYTAALNRARVPVDTVTGWIDWQYYREEKCERDVLATVGAMAELRDRGFPLKYVIVDGGWCAYASEWLQPCAKFPSGMKVLAQRLQAAGFRLGLWLAPYLTNVNTAVAREHREWLVIDKASGQPLHRPNSNVGPCFVLDFTVPGALDWLRQTVRTMVRDWGIGYLKLDGPCLAHYEGGRFHDPTVTAVRQVRRSLEVIREECGEAVLVEGEGIYGPAIGCVDLQRTTQDNHPFWVHPESGAPILKENLKNDLLSAFMHNRFWHNHRENVVLRDFPSPFHFRRAQNPALTEPVLPDHELRFQLSAAALAGGAMLLADPMEQLCRSPERMALIGKFLPHCDTVGVPLDVFCGSRTPSLYLASVKRDFEEWFIAGVFNWGDGYQDFALPLERFTGGGDWHAFDFWGERYLGVARSVLPLPAVPAHGCRMIGLRRRADHPQLVGTNLHLFQGGVDLETVAYEQDTLLIRVSHFIQEEARIFVWHPPECVLHRVETDAQDHLLDQRRPGLIAVTFNGRPTTTFAFHWRTR